LQSIRIAKRRRCGKPQILKAPIENQSLRPKLKTDVAFVSILRILDFGFLWDLPLRIMRFSPGSIMSKLANKTALITGGGSGIGLATARCFLDEGARVIIAGRDVAKLAAASKALNGGARLAHHAADVSKVDQVQALVRRTNELFGRIDILVNNAGLNIKDRTIQQLTPESWNQLVRANLDGTFYCIHAVLPQMLERHDGVIINISSVAGKRAWPVSGAGYSAAKFGVTGLSSCVGGEVKDEGIRVSTIFPGEVDTPILQQRPVPLTEDQRQRMLKSEDVAAAVLFVATLPPHVSVPELIIKPLTQVYL
jgi:NADP-dependent 3-hydroxy acid dehydrogenase YdfG